MARQGNGGGRSSPLRRAAPSLGRRLNRPSERGGKSGQTSAQTLFPVKSPQTSAPPPIGQNNRPGPGAASLDLRRFAVVVGVFGIYISFDFVALTDIHFDPPTAAYGPQVR